MHAASITDLQAVDFALGDVIASAFACLAMEGPENYQRFLARELKEKIFYARNDDVQSILYKISKRQKGTGVNNSENTEDKNVSSPDLPCVVYYREQGLVGDTNQKPVVFEAVRLAEGATEITGDGSHNAMRLTTLPLTLTYSLLFLAWDRATIERIGLAWAAHTTPLGRKYSRFMVPYDLSGERLEVPASLNAPREILTSSEAMLDGGQRLWGARTMVEVNTQAVYGEALTVPTPRLVYGIGLLE